MAAHAHGCVVKMAFGLRRSEAYRAEQEQQAPAHALQQAPAHAPSSLPHLSLCLCPVPFVLLSQ